MNANKKLALLKACNVMECLVEHIMKMLRLEECKNVILSIDSFSKASSINNQIFRTFFGISESAKFKKYFAKDSISTLWKSMWRRV